MAEVLADGDLSMRFTLLLRLDQGVEAFGRGLLNGTLSEALAHHCEVRLVLFLVQALIDQLDLIVRRCLLLLLLSPIRLGLLDMDRLDT